MPKPGSRALGTRALHDTVCLRYHPHCGQWSHTVESSLRRLALCPAVGPPSAKVMELASKLWSWAQLHNLEFQKSPHCEVLELGRILPGSTLAPVASFMEAFLGPR